MMRTFVGKSKALALALVAVSLTWVCEGPAQATINISFCAGPDATKVCKNGTAPTGGSGATLIAGSDYPNGVVVTNLTGTDQAKVQVDDSTATTEWLKLLGSVITFTTQDVTSYPIVITASGMDANPDLSQSPTYRIQALNQSFIRGIGVPVGDQVKAKGFVNATHIGTIPTSGDPYLLKIFYGGSGTTFFNGIYNQSNPSGASEALHDLVINLWLTAKKNDVVKFQGSEGLILKYLPGGGEGDGPTDCDACPTKCDACPAKCDQCSPFETWCWILLLLLILSIIGWFMFMKKK